MPRCSKCKRPGLTARDFHRNQRGHWCRPCLIAYNRVNRRRPASLRADAARKRWNRASRRDPFATYRNRSTPVCPWCKSSQHLLGERCPALSHRSPSPKSTKLTLSTVSSDRTASPCPTVRSRIMKMYGLWIMTLLVPLAMKQHAAHHEREAAYWRGEFVDDDFDPNYRHWWERQVPKMERWE